MYTTLHRAAFANKLGIVEALLDWGANIEAAGYADTGSWKPAAKTALSIAIDVKAKEAAKCLCMHGAVVREGDVMGLQALGLSVLDPDMKQYWRSLTKEQQDKRLPPVLAEQLRQVRSTKLNVRGGVLDMVIWLKL